MAGRGEDYDEEWELVCWESSEEEANCYVGAGEASQEAVYIAVKRRRVSGKKSHICDVRVVFDHMYIYSV